MQVIVLLSADRESCQLNCTLQIMDGEAVACMSACMFACIHIVYKMFSHS